MSNSFKGDSLGFTFNGTHSSDLGIVRTSGGDRFEKNLLPNFRDTTSEIPGSDGSFYFNSQYQQNPFSVNFAFDDLKEVEIKKIRKLFADKQIHDLIFDEEPYKVYSVKVSSPPRINYICFDNKDKTARVYKGEGSVQFTAFYPFARAGYKTLPEYYVTTVGSRHYDANGVCVEEWAEASGLKTSLTTPTLYDAFSSGTANLYNPGDVQTPLYLTFTVASAGTLQFTYNIAGDQKERMVIDTSKLVVGQHYRLNSKLKLIEGGAWSSPDFTPDNLIYNQALLAGDFITIEATPANQTLVMTPTNLVTMRQLRYDYLYL